ncbi:MAG: hypothetical protein ACFFB2_03695 [Promethearchaeota archaeon]
MNYEDLKEASLKIFEAIFTNQHGVELDGQFYPIHRVKSGLRNVTYHDI